MAENQVVKLPLPAGGGEYDTFLNSVSIKKAHRADVSMQYGNSNTQLPDDIYIDAMYWQIIDGFWCQTGNEKKIPGDYMSLYPAGTQNGSNQVKEDLPIFVDIAFTDKDANRIGGLSTWAF